MDLSLFFFGFVSLYRRRIMLAWENNEIMSLSLILVVGVGYGFISLEMFGKPIEPRINHPCCNPLIS
jgi:hypothetical protein